MNELDILGFNPQDLFNHEETPHTSGNQNIYKPRPADSKTANMVNLHQYILQYILYLL